MRREASEVIAGAAGQREGLQDPAKAELWRWAAVDVDGDTLLARVAREVNETCGLIGAGISSLDPGAHLRAHTGPSNGRWTLHLGLDVAEREENKITLRVGDETRVGAWRQGRVVLFDDSFEHEVTHDGEHRRVVLDIAVPHPDLRLNSSPLDQKPEF